MRITMTKVGDLFTCSATSELDGVSWTTEHPMPIEELARKLQELGFHQTDIGDALFEADPTFMADDPTVLGHKHLRDSRERG